MTRFVCSAVLLTLGLFGGVALAGKATEMWRGYLRVSPVCVAGKWRSVVSDSDEAGVNRYRCEMEVEQVIAGTCADKKITLSFVRVETKAEELPYLKEGEQCIVFLKWGKTKQDDRYLLANTKWGLQPFSEELARQIGDAVEVGRGQGGEGRNPRQRERGSAIPAQPANPDSATDDKLVGKWLLTMPAGFEYEAQFERAETKNDVVSYRLTTKATNLRGVYAFIDGRLTLVQPDEANMAGLAWEIKNRNVILLVVHPESAHVGADYRNASLTRK
jgi:hypothetical protein